MSQDTGSEGRQCFVIPKKERQGISVLCPTVQ